MIVLLTDFGGDGPYVGEMLAVLACEAPSCPALNLMWDLPRWRPLEAGHLVAPLVAAQPPGTVFIVVVDPGVGSRDRRPVWLQADGRILVGPDNGVLDIVARRAVTARMHEILWRPRSLSATFHGRDLFAPAAARLAEGRVLRSRPLRRRFASSARRPDDLDRVIYVDGFGNCMTGRRASTLAAGTTISVAGKAVPRGRTFSDVPRGSLVWFRNSLGLVEIAANQADASALLELAPGAPVLFS